MFWEFNKKYLNMSEQFLHLLNTLKLYEFFCCQMDVRILKDLYQNLDTIDNFIILVENNYDPDKKLLYQILQYVINSRIIKREEINLICDMINKLILQKNYEYE